MKLIKKLGKILGAGILLGIILIEFPSLHQRYIANAVGDQIVRIVGPTKHNHGGTGFQITAPSGTRYVITNRHVCLGVQEDGAVAANLPDDSERYIKLQVKEISKTTDLCLLEGLPGKQGLALAGSLSLNETVYVVGHPLLEHSSVSPGMATSFENIQIADGVGLSDEDCANAGGTNQDALYLGFIPVKICVVEVASVRLTANSFPGNSGSPVVDVFGHVIGVNFAGNGTTNWGFAVPLNDLKSFLNDR